MKKMIIFGVGLLLAGGAVFFAASNKPLSAEEALLLANVEAIAQNENNEKGYAQIIDAKSACKITHNGRVEYGFYATCEPNAGDLVSCASGCLTSAELH